MLLDEYRERSSRRNSKNITKRVSGRKDGHYVQ